MNTTELVMVAVQALLGMVAFFGALVGKNLTDAIKELRETDKNLADKFDSYVRLDSMQGVQHQLDAIFSKLDDIKDALGDKVHREECHRNRHGGK